MATSRLSVRLFGAIAVSHGATALGVRDFGGTKAKQLFEILVLARGEPVPKDRLADLIWGESLPVHVNATLETYVSVLRRKLAEASASGRDLITTQREAYALPAEGYDLDLARFDELLRMAEAAENSARRRYLEDALALATGPVLADEPYADWAIDERWRYERRVIDASLAAASAAMADRDPRGALVHAERVIASEELEEQGYEAGIIALRALGRDRDAIALYDRCCVTLEREGGVEVSPALRALRASIGRHEAIKAAPRGAELLHAPCIRPRASTTRLLGRAPELELLDHVLEATRTGASELVLIEGERGIGKTALLEAACFDATGVSLGWASCSELVSGVPFAAIALALREVLGDSLVDVRDYPGLAVIFPEMLVRSKRPLPRIGDALESLVALLDALAPIVLVIDDLQWADAEALMALDYLRRRGPLHGVSVIAAARPEELSSSHPVRRLRPTMQIALGPLDAHDVAPLGIGDLYHRTEGHPLYISLAVASDADGKRSLAEYVEARCRAEGEDDYQLVSTACLLEEAFSASRLAGILGRPTTGVAEALDRLCRRRLLAHADGQFRFRTRAMREAMADSLSAASRSLLEQRISRDGPPGPRTRRSVLRMGGAMQAPVTAQTAG
jgi:DNA-binding SARP family transcriptional activator